MHIWPIPAIDISPFDELSESRPVALVTSQAAWEAVRGRLRLPIVSRADVQEATEAHWNALLPRVTAGAEVVYAVESELGGGLPHGDLVGPGIVLMAEKQGRESLRLRRALRACNVPLDRIPQDVVQSTLHALPAYVRRHGLPYGIAHELVDR